MDRKNPQLAKLQESFINHLVAPLCNAYGEAGLLPGEWDDSVTDDDVSIPNSPEGSSGSESECRNSDEEAGHSMSESDLDTQLSEGCGSGSDTPVHSKRSPAGRKIICLQTQHLQENHRYWVAKIQVNYLTSKMLLGTRVLSLVKTPGKRAETAHRIHCWRDTNGLGRKQFTLLKPRHRGSHGTYRGGEQSKIIRSEFQFCKLLMTIITLVSCKQNKSFISIVVYRKRKILNCNEPHQSLLLLSFFRIWFTY